MKIKNITTENFKFEGIEIPVGGVIEVDNLTGQRLLALYWHRKLELVEEKMEEKVEEKMEEKMEEKQEVIEVVTEQPKEQEIVEQSEQKESTEPQGFVCDKCGKVFTKKVGLIVHKRFCKK
jgi:hypothetical protein